MCGLAESCLGWVSVHAVGYSEVLIAPFILDKSKLFVELDESARGSCAMIVVSLAWS
jgi:hypothetical protein